jgi:hypothetical protein
VVMPDLNGPNRRTVILYFRFGSVAIAATTPSIVSAGDIRGSEYRVGRWSSRGTRPWSTRACLASWISHE